MGYDMSIGNESFSYTYNVSAMWCAAIPETGIRTHYGMRGKKAIIPLRKIYNYMVLHRDELIKLNPPNGWGDFDGALDFINDLIHASLRNPKERWKGD